MIRATSIGGSLSCSVRLTRTHAGFIPVGIPEDWFEDWTVSAQDVRFESWLVASRRKRWFRFNEAYGLMAEAAD